MDIERLKSKLVIFSDDEQSVLYDGTSKVIKSQLNLEPYSISPSTVERVLIHHFDSLLSIYKDTTLRVVNICSIENDDINILKFFPKAVFVNAIINFCSLNEQLRNNPIVMDRAKQIVDYASINNLQEEIFTFEIDNKVCNFPTKKIINFITYDRHQYDFNKPDIKIEGYTKNEFFFMLKMFFQQESIKDTVLLTEQDAEFIRAVISDRLANTYHFNRINQTTDINLQDTKLNEDFKNSLLSKIPENFSPLEKSIYLYIKLCQTLTYDPEFYSEKGSEEIAKKSEDLDSLQHITAENSNVVCYQFIQIYAKLLNEFGINYQISKTGNKRYGGGHASITFRVEDYIVSADPLKDFKISDLYKAKVNERIDGLNCLNVNSQSRTDFEDSVTKVYNYIKKNEHNLYVTTEGTKAWSSMLYDLNGEMKIDINQKFEIYKEKMEESQLPLLEKFTYSSQLLKVIFEQDIKDEKLKYTTLKKVRYLPEGKISLPVKLIEFKHENNTEYYFIDEKGRVKETSKEAIRESMTNGTYKFRTEEDSKNFNFEDIKV